MKTSLLIFLSDLLVDISACASSADTTGCPIAADVGWREIGVVVVEDVSALVLGELPLRRMKTATTVRSTTSTPATAPMIGPVAVPEGGGMMLTGHGDPVASKVRFARRREAFLWPRLLWL